MANSLDMSLDDLIKNNKPFRGRGRGGGSGGFRRGGFRGGGGFRSGRGRRGPMRRGGGLPVRFTPYKIAKNDMFEDSMEAFGVQLGFETGTKLYVSNLDYGVSNDDMKVGKMK